ncbi:MAG: hypothetical protein CJBNEKGG_00175 [Prosthecobacter sp.]|nr:hypothetical protein [Prosthecobacter sp.]
MIEAEILREKFRDSAAALQKLLRQRFVILFHLALCMVLAVVSLHPEWLPKGVRVRFLPLLMLPLAAAAVLSWWRHRRRPSPVELARVLEKKDPELNGLAVTAAELLGKSEPTFLERRVISQCSDAAAARDWKKLLLGRREAAWGSRNLVVVTLLLVACIFISSRSVWRHDHRPRAAASAKTPPAPEAPAYAATITPGDVEIEKGSRLVVEAAFAGDVPAEAVLLVNEPDGGERDRIPMRLTVDEKVFGGMITRVDKDALYHVAFSDGKSREHRITTFVHPALERVDVKITPPAYTRLPSREIRNTMKVSAHEGSRIEFTLKVNKPVKDAELFGEDKTILPLKPSAADPTLLTATLGADRSQKWRVHLVDDRERANKNPPWITVTVQTNQLAKIEVVFPKRDVQVSQIQELPVEARVWDDLGVSRSGASFSIAGRTREVVFKHGPTAPAQKQEVKELLALEGESTQPRQLVSYHFWAEDTGPQGEVRRAMSDMFFAEVRHFEDIFREGDSPPGEPGKEPKGDTDKLVELQKQIVNATWRIVRETSAGKTMENAAPDAAVVHQSQGMALEQAKEAMEKAEDTQVKNALTEAWKSMKDALGPLEQAAEQKKRASLNQALAFEQGALEWLHQAQGREHMIMRSKSAKTASGKQKQMQNQLMNLELKQEEQRYEEEKQAGEEQSAEQQENLQVLNRLKELARRQEALAEKMKELQNQLAKAETEEKKEELQNQLKRLEEEQQQLLSDIDDLQQRMEKPENAASMAEAKQQLEQTREQVNDAAEKLKQEKLSEAASSATRAQRELEKMQEDFKQKTARRFTEEMKQMRQQAREVADKQRQISETLENQKTPDGPKDDTSASLDQMLKGGEVARQIQEQQEKVAGLLENMKRVSEQAEGSNPLLHRRLYEAVREARTGGLEEHLDEARMQSRYGQRAEAQEAERKAGSLVENLQQGVDKAAESVLGSETEALRMARAELDKLIDEAKEEGGKAAGEQTAPKEGSSPAEAGKKGSAAQDKPSSETASAGKNEEGRGASGQENSTASSTDKPASTESPDKTRPGQPNQKESMAQGQAQGAGEPSGNPSAGGRQRSSQQLAVDRSSQPRSPGERSLGGAAGASGGADDGDAFFFDQGAETMNNRPFTGDGYDRWADRLRNVEELLNQPDLRNEAAKVLDNAREMKINHDRNDLAPQADHLQLRILTPLVELRDRVAEELAKRDAKNPTVPIDRDPVPPAFRDLVKRYYQELGGGQ